MTTLDGQKRAVTGVVPPQVAEAAIRTTWPGVADIPPLAGLTAGLMRTIILAPVAWLILAPWFALKLATLPIMGKNYRLTNRRVLIRRGFRGSPSQEAALADIEDVRLREGSYSTFYRSGDLEVIVKGQVAMRLEAVKHPETFRRAILNAKAAWAKPASA